MQICTNIHAHIVSVIISLCMNTSYLSLPCVTVSELVLTISYTFCGIYFISANPSRSTSQYSLRINVFQSQL